MNVSHQTSESDDPFEKWAAAGFGPGSSSIGPGGVAMGGFGGVGGKGGAGGAGGMAGSGGILGAAMGGFGGVGGQLGVAIGGFGGAFTVAQRGFQNPPPIKPTKAGPSDG